MKLKSKRGSITIFQIISIAMIVVVFATLTSSLVKLKTRNNLKRTEKLISESLLNMYDNKLYNGFSLLAYEEDEEIIADIKGFYEKKYNVSILVKSKQYMTDYNMVNQMKNIVIARLGVSYLDDISEKLDIKDDIVSMISKGKEIRISMEKNLEIYDDFLDSSRSIASLLIDIKNGFLLEELDEKYSISKINQRLDRLIDLYEKLNASSSQSPNNQASFILDKIEVSNNLITSSGQIRLIDSIRLLKKVFNEASASDTEISLLDYELAEIGDRLVVSSDYELNNNDKKDKINYWKMYDTFKNYHKLNLNDHNYHIDFDFKPGQASNLTLEPFEKLAFIEYLTIMLSDKLKSGKRDHYQTNRSPIKGFENSELEYVITGLNPRDAHMQVKKFIKTIRFPINLLHIYTSSEKRNSVNTFALLISSVIPIPTFVSSPVISAAWAYLETSLDIKAIYKGNSVAFIKITSKDWISDFSILKDSLSKDNFNLNSLNDTNDFHPSGSISLDKDKSDKEIEKDDNPGLVNGKNIELYYNDYLRIMALTKSSSQMMQAFKVLLDQYMSKEGFNINNLVVEHEVQIYLDKKHKYKFEESLIDGYIKE